MGAMRTLLLSAVLAAVAAPAAGQILSPNDQMQIDMLRMQQEAAQRRAIDQANQLEAASARLRAEQATLDLRLQRGEVGPPPVPRLPYEAAPAPGPAPAVIYPSIPDAALADSNRRVQEAARNRR